MPVSSPTSRPLYRCPTCKSASENPRNLVVCVDGTSLDRNSNVWKLYEKVIDRSLEGSGLEQHRYYLVGIGAYDLEHLPPLERTGIAVYRGLELSLAWNVEKNVKDAYSWLAGVYREGDQIYLFGFSRGAYQVRVLTSMIHEVGLVREKENTEVAFNHYLTIDPYEPETRNKATQFKQAFCWQGVRIHFVGVWHTVSSLGFVKSNVHVTESASVTYACHFRHALALDERRVKFMPEYFLEVNALRTNIRSHKPAVSDMKEVWFAGSHPDVGGVDRSHDQMYAYSQDDDVAPCTVHAGNVPLVWMRQEAAAKGLVFDPEEFAWDPQDVDFGTRNSMTFPWKMFELLPTRHQVSFTGAGRHKWRNHLSRPPLVIPGQQIHPSVLSGDMYMPRATLGSGIGIPTARTSDGLWATETQDEEAATRLLSSLLDDQQRMLACLEKVLFLLDSGLNNEQIQLIPRPQWSGEDILRRPGFDQFALAVIYDVTSHFTAPEELVRDARASLCSILSFPDAPDAYRALYIVRFSTRHQTLRRHFIGHNDVIGALVLALEWTAKHSNENLFRLVTDSLCNLIADDDIRRQVIDRLSAGPDRTRGGRSRLSVLLEVKVPNQLMASLKTITSFAKFQPGCCEELMPKLIKLAKKERGPVGSAAVEAMVEMNGPLTRDIHFPNILGYLCNTLPLLDAEGGSAYLADNIGSLPSVLQVNGSGPLDEGIMDKLLSTIRSRDDQERAAATLTLLKLCGNWVVRESCSRQVLGIFMQQLEQQGTSLLAAYALWTCLKYNMWSSDDFFLATRPILDMVDRGWFDDAVGRLEGCQVFRRLMMSDELRQRVIDLGIVDILLKKLEVGDRHEVRMSLICLDILEENSLALTPIVVGSITRLKDRDKGAQRKGVKVLSALARTVAGEQAIKPHVIDIVKMLLPSSDRPSVSRSHLSGPAAALRELCKNETLRVQIESSSEFNEWQRYLRGEDVDSVGDKLYREIDGTTVPSVSQQRLPRKRGGNSSNRQSKLPKDVSRVHIPSGRNLKPYAGPTKLVVAFDIGTTYSGVSYCILEPGQVPEILGITRFPAQELLGGDARVPSLLYYDQDGNLRAAGAEVLTENVMEVALTEGWTRAEWWKLHLMPKHLASAINLTDDLPPLPPGKPVIDILTDFIKHLFHCTKTYIEEHHPSFTWATHENITEYILTHPNGWEGVQQQLYRQAVERAGLVPGTPEGRSRVHLLAEGEASLHFYVLNLLDVGTANEPTPRGVVIIDIGGATINLSMFSMMADPISCEEIAPAECRLQGSVFVTHRAKALLQRKLEGWEHFEGWEHSSEEEIAEFTREFDNSTKLVIKSDQEPAYVRVASRNYNNTRYNIKFGKLELSGPEATDVFNDSINAIINAFEQQLQSATVPITTVFLVGGLSTNVWVWFRLQSYFKARNIDICRPDNHINKAVTNGAVLSRIDRDNRLVTSRVARVTYGVVCALPVDEDEEGHNRRKDQWEIDPTGDRYLPGCFEPIIRKRARISDEVEFRESFSLTERNPKHFGTQTVRLVCYTGNLSDQDRVDEDESSFSTFCSIHVDLGAAVKDVILRKTRGQFYYELDYDVIIFLGLTEIQAYLEWKTREGGQGRIPGMVSFDLDS